MKVLLLGATGKIGSRILKLLVAQNIAVNAFVHNAAINDQSGLVQVFNGDVHDEQDIKKAIEGCEAVVSALGSWGTKQKDILSSAMTNLIPVMQQQHVSRIVSLTGADAFLDSDKPGAVQKMSHMFFGTLAPTILRDGEKHMAQLAASDLDWTVLRSPVMNEHGSNSFKIDDIAVKPWQTIHRDAVAAAMVELLINNNHIHGAPYLHRN